MNNRRRIIITLSTAALVPPVVSGQTKRPPVVIGWLSAGSGPGRSFPAFREGLEALGWKEGETIVIEVRYAEGQVDRLEPLTEELVARRAALIVTSSMRAASRAAKVAAKTPIVMVTYLDPVAAGMVKSLARPDGMITGLAGFNIDISSKRLSLLIAAAPKLKVVGFISSSVGRILDKLLEVTRRAAAHHGVDARIAVVQRPEEFNAALMRLVSEGAQGLVVLPGAVVEDQRPQVMQFARAQGWPVAGTSRRWTDDGALLSYAADGPAIFRRAAWYVDRILKGAKPGDLPIEQPTTFEFVVNLKTAEGLGLTMPPEIMVQATRVIQ